MNSKSLDQFYRKSKIFKVQQQAIRRQEFRENQHKTL